MTITTKRFIRCLSCPTGEWPIDHLIDCKHTSTFGPWPCPCCGAEHRGTAGGGAVDYQLTGETWSRPPTLLKLDRSYGDVYLVVKGNYFPGSHRGAPMPGGSFFDSGAEYTYDSGTCPTNYLTEVLEVFTVTTDRTGQEEGSTDPHGLFRYIRTAGDYDPSKFGDDDVQARLAHFCRGLTLSGEDGHGLEYCVDCKQLDPLIASDNLEVKDGEPVHKVICMTCGREELAARP